MGRGCGLPACGARPDGRRKNLLIPDALSGPSGLGRSGQAAGWGRVLYGRIRQTAWERRTPDHLPNTVSKGTVLLDSSHSSVLNGNDYTVIRMKISDRIAP